MVVEEPMRKGREGYDEASVGKIARRALLGGGHRSEGLGEGRFKRCGGEVAIWGGRE